MHVHRVAQRAARAVYGSIIAVAVIVVLDEGGAEADEVIAAVIGSVIAATAAEQYAEYIGLVIRQRRHLDAGEVKESAVDAAAGALAALATLLPFVAVEFGLIEVDTAYELALWLGVGVIAAYALLANRLAGLSLRRNLLTTGVAVLIAASLIAIKALTH